MDNDVQSGLRQSLAVGVVTEVYLGITPSSGCWNGAHISAADQRSPPTAQMDKSVSSEMRCQQGPTEEPKSPLEDGMRKWFVCGACFVNTLVR